LSSEQSPVIDVSKEARAVVSARGGCLWIWTGDDGLARTATSAPSEPLEFTEYASAGIRVFQDARIPTPLVWRIVLDSRRPERVRAYWNSSLPGGLPGVGWRFWRELFRRRADA
jgi:hypothetical protein